METRPTQHELNESNRRNETQRRDVAIRMVEAINANPDINFHRLAEILGVYLEVVCIAIARINSEKLPVSLKHPEGRGVNHEGKITDELGQYQ